MRLAQSAECKVHCATLKLLFSSRSRPTSESLQKIQCKIVWNWEKLIFWPNFAPSSWWAGMKNAKACEQDKVEISATASICTFSTVNISDRQQQTMKAFYKNDSSTSGGGFPHSMCKFWQRNLKGISKLIVWIMIHPVTMHFSMQSVWKEKQWCFKRYTVFLKHSMWCCCCLWWAPHETCICQVYVSVLHWNNYTYSFAPSFQEKDD